MTQEQAVALSKTEWWIGRSAHDVVMFQLFESRLCMPWAVFHSAVEEVLGRGVFTHEFCLSGHEHLKQEFLGERDAPSFNEILDLIPSYKRILLVDTAGEGE